MNKEFFHFPRLEAIANSMNWNAKEVLKDFDGKPHLMVRLVLRGPTFDFRALEPIVWVGGVASKCVEISDDGTEAKAYFDTPPVGGDIEFGYEDGVVYRWGRNFDVKDVPRLDRKKLPQKLKMIDGW